jgi:hypothetical protein
MNAKELSVEVYNALVEIDYTRKPNSFGGATQTNFNSLSAEIKEAINSFPQSYVDLREDLMDIDSLDGKQQFYLFTNENGFYLVDTQGYNYPRYITELVDFDQEEEDDTFEQMEGLIRIADSQIFDSVVKSLVLELKQEDFHQSDILNFLQFKLDMAISKVSKK